MRSKHPHVPQRPSRIVVADDHARFRSTIRQVLEEQPDLELVGEAADGEQAVELSRRLRPELMLMDVRMPRIDGVEATRVIKRESRRTIVLMLSAFADPDYLWEALQAGASGYLLKHLGPQEMVESIRRVLAGEFPLDDEVAMRLLLRLIEEKHREAAEPKAPLPMALSPREVEVLRLLAQGQTNEQIASDLFISVGTVKIHVHHIINKLGVSDRVHAAMVAIEHGLISFGIAEFIDLWLVGL